MKIRVDAERLRRDFDALAAFGGIRIEDDVVVQDQGIRNLTREVLPVGGGQA